MARWNTIIGCGPWITDKSRAIERVTGLCVVCLGTREATAQGTPSPGEANTWPSFLQGPHIWK